MCDLSPVHTKVIKLQWKCISVSKREYDVFVFIVFSHLTHFQLQKCYLFAIKDKYNLQLYDLNTGTILSLSQHMLF